MIRLRVDRRLAQVLLQLCLSLVVDVSVCVDPKLEVVSELCLMDCRNWVLCQCLLCLALDELQLIWMLPLVVTMMEMVKWMKVPLSVICIWLQVQSKAVVF